MVRLELRLPDREDILRWHNTAGSIRNAAATCSIDLSFPPSASGNPLRLEAVLVGESLDGVGLHINALARLLDTDEMNRLLKVKVLPVVPVTVDDGDATGFESPARAAANQVEPRRVEAIRDPKVAATSEMY